MAEPPPTATPVDASGRGSAKRRRSPWPWLLVLAAAACLVALLASGGSRIVFDRGVELTGAEVSREASPGRTITVTLHVQTRGPLLADDLFFVHVENVQGGVDAPRLNRDVAPSVPPTQWGSQAITATAEIPVPAGTPPGHFEVYAGLYDEKSGDRLDLQEPATPDDRAFVGWLDVTAEGADDSTRLITPRQMRFEGTWARWTSWLGGVLVASALAGWALARRRAEVAPEDKEIAGTLADPSAVWVRRLTYAAPALPFILGIFLVLEFIKDDAYISFRYTHNLVTGAGLVFNHGERLEGFTNFLWVLLMAPFEALGWDLFQVCEVLGTALGIACLVVTGRMTAWINGEREGLTHVWGAFWLASSSSFVLWAKSGLEQPLASLLPIGGAAVLWTARARADRHVGRSYLVAGLLMGAGCMTRPELHLLAILVGAPLVVDAVRRRRVTAAEWLYVAGILAVTVPCHTFRYLYFGSLVPNTFYVKTGTGAVVRQVGLHTLRDMFLFNGTGLLVILAPMAFANRARVVEKATMAAIAVAFMAYYVNVGVDEMQWHRLYLPALPFLCVLAAVGGQNLVEAAARTFASEARRPRARLVGAAVGWIAVFGAARSHFQFTAREFGGFNGHGDLAGTYHPDLGKFLVRHERPHALVAFQDMGSTPYHAPDLDFLDFFGLVDGTVAHARHDLGIHTFIGAPRAATEVYDARMREYFFGRSPEWVIFTIYTPRGQEQEMAALFDKDPTGGSFGDAYDDNDVQFGLWDDPRFQQQYVPVRTWPRSRSYYLALWRRKDLWSKTPREVVLDAAPPGLSGVQATFEGGLELLGSEMTRQTPERHEAFITTWWKLPGPMPADLYFFVHVTGKGVQVPADHVPGDWMYPADRWAPGQILEDRTLFQLPPFVMTPGKYTVYLGAFRRSTGERLKVLRGAAGGDDRLVLGTLEVTPLHPLVQQLIPPTDVAVMRKYPDRITDSGRR